MDENLVATPDTIQIGAIQKGRQGERIYSRKCQAITFSAHGGGRAARTGAYLIDGIVRRLHPTECAKIMGFTRSAQTMVVCSVVDVIALIDNPMNRRLVDCVLGVSVEIIVLRRVVSNAIHIDLRGIACNRDAKPIASLPALICINVDAVGRSTEARNNFVQKCNCMDQRSRG